MATLTSQAGNRFFELAVAATRKGKSIRNKSGSKKEVKQSKFVARHRIRRTTLVLCSSRSLALPMTWKISWIRALTYIANLLK